MLRLARLIAGILAFCCAQAAFAFAPVAAEPFAHSSWTSKDGIPGMVQALAQTPDGYLWIGTYEGLYRFDGVTFEKVEPAPGHPPGSIPISALHVTRGGELWVGYSGGAGVERRQAGRLVRGSMPEPPNAVTKIVEDLEGTIWTVGGPEQRALKRYRQGRWERIDARFGVPDDEAVSSLFAARDGTIWLATQSRLLFLRRGFARFVDTGLLIANGASMAEDPAGNIWISDPTGTWMLPDYSRGRRSAKLRTFYPASGSVLRTNILFDNDGNLWGSTYTGGVFRIARPGGASRGAVRRYRTQDGLTSNQAVALFRDREGNIWVATELGLDQFRTASLERVPVPQPRATTGYHLAVDDRGIVYIANGSALYHALPGEDPKPLLQNVDAHALCPGRGGVVWIATPDAVLRLEKGRPVRTLRLPDRVAASSCTEDGEGRLWLSRPERNLLVWDGQGWRAQHPTQDQSAPRDIITSWLGRPVASLARRSVWLAGRPGADPIPNERIGVAGLTAIQGTSRALMIAGGVGMVRWDGKRIQRLNIEDHPWLRGIRGMVQTARGETWMINNRGVLRMSTAALDRGFADPARPIPHILFDEQDGFISRAQNSAGAQIVEAGDGRLWFLTRQGVLRIDPARIRRNNLAPPVSIRALTADGRRYPDPTRIDLPAGTRNLSIDYSALSMTLPSRVGFRYKLEGVDQDWIDPGTRRQAFYTNLSPGDYRFRVIGANNDGVWNREGAALDFTIRPTFLQSGLFALLCLLAVAALLWLAYYLRMRALTRRMHSRMVERLDERERIARELHDTLLQGVQALVLRFQLAADDIPPEQPTRRTLEVALDKADQVLAEGRDRVRSLRVAGTGDDLERSVREIVRRQGFSRNTKVHLETQGNTRPLNPLVGDEVTRIANEALFNTWRHAQASRIEIEIVFRSSHFAIRFRDNGVGIPSDIVKAGGRQDHFGLVGMRERAARIQGTLTVRSVPGVGTEIALTVPASTAYSRRGKGLARFLRLQRNEENV